MSESVTMITSAAAYALQSSNGPSADSPWAYHFQARIALPAWAFQNNEQTLTDRDLSQYNRPISTLGTDTEPTPGDRSLSICQRLGELKLEAMKERLSISVKSEEDLLSFLKKHRTSRRPYLFVLDNGNFRAVWKNSDGEQIGLQFRGDGEIQFVIFAKRSDAKHRATAYGRDSFIGIERQIEAHDLRKLLRS